MNNNTSDYDDLAQEFQRYVYTFASISQRIEDAIQTIKSGALVGNPGMPLSDFIQDGILSEASLLRSTLDELVSETISPSTVTNIDSSQALPHSSSLGHFYRHVFPPISPVLISPAASKKISSLLEFFPNTFSASVLFESRLDGIDEQVDVSLLINPHFDNGRKLLSSPNDMLFQSAPHIHKDARWKKIVQFCQHWSDKTSQLNPYISSMWLEFDLPVNQQEDLPPPSLFFNFTEPIGDNLLAAIGEVLHQSIKANHVDKCLSTIERIAQSLSHPLSIRWIGLMHGRNSSDVRLYLELSPEEILATLEDLGWLNDDRKRQEALVDLQPRLMHLADFCDRLILDITLSQSGIGSQIGIECSYRNSRQVQVEPRWRELINMLVNLQLCTPEKAAAILSWSGYSVAEFTPLGKTQVVLRKLSHIKLQYRPLSWQQAKIYYQYAASEITKPSKSIHLKNNR